MYSSHSLPLRLRCSIEPKFLDVGTLAFGVPKTVVVRITNDGPVDAYFHFISPPRPKAPSGRGGGGGGGGGGGARGGGGGGGGNEWSRVTWDDDQPLCPPWLRLAPEEGTVEAGEWGCAWPFQS
jgi:hypothetical protein